ncbi:MAG: hypothetical protein ABI068_11950, partial [Ktedonobacterales bacterium]
MDKKMAEFTPDVIVALNALLEDERASVEMAVALACGATEIQERTALAAMGVEDIATCESLRAQMEAAAAPVTRRINGVVFQVLGEERYDDRLRAYAHHQRIVAERCRELLSTLDLDAETRALAQGVSEAHQRHSEWCDHRADVFSVTRVFALSGDGQGVQGVQGIAAPQAVDTGAVRTAPAEADREQRDERNPDAQAATIASSQAQPALEDTSRAPHGSRDYTDYDPRSDTYSAAIPSTL